MHIRTDDVVEVILGDDRGTRGRVLRVDRKAGTVVVEGINRVWKHVRRSQRNPQGGRVHKEMPIQLSNVQLICPACGAVTRTGARSEPDGGKVRFCKKCKAAIGRIAPPRAKQAKNA